MLKMDIKQNPPSGRSFAALRRENKRTNSGKPKLAYAAFALGVRACERTTNNELGGAGWSSGSRQLPTATTAHGCCCHQQRRRALLDHGGAGRARGPRGAGRRPGRRRRGRGGGD